MQRTLLRWLWPTLWMGVIYRASATPNLLTVPIAQRLGLLPSSLSAAAVSVLELILRKSAHVASFGILAALLYRALPEGNPDGRHLRRWVGALAGTVLYACLDEWHQTFVPGRAGRLTDVLIDTAGGVMGLAAVYLSTQRRRTRC